MLLVSNLAAWISHSEIAGALTNMHHSEAVGCRMTSCISAGARTVIANAAYSFLHPWSHKGNMAVRLKKLHESAQARYEKSREWLVDAVAKQPQAPAGACLAALVTSQ